MTSSSRSNNITKTGSTGAVIYEWYKKEESTTRVATWMKLTEAPREVGNYKVVVIVAGDAIQVGLCTGLMMYFRKKTYKEE